MTDVLRSVWLGICAAGLLGVLSAGAVGDDAQIRVLPAGELPHDHRLGPLKDRNGYFPFTPPATLDEWSARADAVRRRILVAAGLWPMPERPAPRAVVHGLVDRDEYTVEKVYLESYPGHFVTGNLYRPKHASGPLPAVLCPYGHWPGGRFQENSLEDVLRQIASGAEGSEINGRFPLQARCVQLARMGCLVFIYDSVGYADSQQIALDDIHRLKNYEPVPESLTDWRYLSTQAELRMQNPFGLQTYNSLCALDWIASLPEVDPQRIAATGASGGASQAFVLGAIDPRLAALFPVVMVSTAMQGGCTCENACCLRVGTGNVGFAALFAPKPLGMVSANDWTHEFATKGYPELQQLYSLWNAEDRVVEETHTEHPHNYNNVSRRAVYGWINRFLNLGVDEPIEETEFVPLTREEMSVWDEAHPAPPSGHAYEQSLLRTLTELSDTQLAELQPHDAESLAKFRDIVGGALSTIIARGLPSPEAITHETVREIERDGFLESHWLVRYEAKQEELPVVLLKPHASRGDVVLWLDGGGKQSLFSSDGHPREEVKKLLTSGVTVAGADLFLQGEFLADGEPPTQTRIVEGPRKFAGHTFGYNPTLLARRVHDILSLVALFQQEDIAAQRVHLVGLHGAGPWVAAARALVGDEVGCTAVDTGGFRFAQLLSWRDVNFLPGIVKYGDVPALLALCAPHKLWLAGEHGTVSPRARQAYDATGAKAQITSFDGPADEATAALVNWLLGVLDQ